MPADPFITQVEDRLDSLGIAHGPLRRIGDWANHSYTDTRTVFVKTNPPEAPFARTRLSREPAAAEWATAHGITAPTPLRTRCLEVTDPDGQGRTVSLWRHHHFTALPYSDSVTLIYATAATLARHVAPDWAPQMPWRDWVNHGLDRAAELRTRTPTSTAPDLLARTFESAGEVLDARYATRPRVACHGDLHPGNTHATPAGPVVGDWETFATAPAEWEYGTIAAFTHTWPGVQHPVTPAEACQAAAATQGLDAPLVAAIAALRAASGAARLLLSGSNPAWAANMIDMLHARTPQR